MGVDIAPVLLHVGLGTFRPVEVGRVVAHHHMHAEYYEISEATSQAMAKARSRGGRVVAVGTTTTRCLESGADADGGVRPGQAGQTSLSTRATGLRSSTA